MKTPETDVASMRALPAWLMSVVFHLVAVIALALIFRGVTKALPAGEPDRPVALVLAQADANKNIEYFDENEQQAEATSESSSTSTQQVATESAAESTLLDSDIELPGRPESSIGTSLDSELVQVPNLTKTGRKPLVPGEFDDAILAEEAARKKKDGPTGPSAGMSMFGGAKAEGHSFVFLIDRSKSMGGDGLGALSAAAKQLTAALSALKPNHKFQVIAYNHTTHYIGPRKLLAATEENKARVPGYFASLVSFGSTAHETALLSALRQKPDVIFFLNDGGDPYLNESQLNRIAKRAGRRTSIHCLQFGFGPMKDENDFMMRLAERTRGSFLYIDMAKRRIGP